jgi:hypothetical protein
MDRGDSGLTPTRNRRALLVGAYQFEDSTLAKLRAPLNDVIGLEEVLSDPDIGDFDVESVTNPTATEMAVAVEAFFKDSKRDDLLLMYFSGHGVKDETGNLHFAVTNTNLNLLYATAVPAALIRDLMDRSRSRSIVLILECCYSGAFAKGMRAKAAPVMDIMDQLEGRGRVILTASSAMEYAFEGDEITDPQGEREPSIFTGAIIRALQTGEADRDGDGYITVDELYDYVYSVVREATPNQTPVRTSFEVEGSIVIAKSRAAARLGGKKQDLDSADEKGDEHLGAMPSQIGARVFNISARAVSDLPSPTDQLGIRPLVDGLTALLNDPATTLPLAIAITAPWGGGKSSTMLQLKNRLIGEQGEAPKRRWFVVEFPAWKYEKSERLWAALAKAVYEQPQQQMSRRERVQFKVKLERRRQSLALFVLKGLGPPLIALLALLVAVLGDLGKSRIGDKSSIVGVTALIVASAAATLSRYWGVIGDPFKRAVEEHASRYQYEQQLGFTSEADQDIQCLTDVLLEAPSHALAVFVDDLDRCSSRYVVEAVEAVNQIFNSVEKRPCVFVLGMDAGIVATSVEVAYQDTVRTLKSQGSRLGHDFGASFLAKIVQMTVAVATPDPRAMVRYLEGVTGNRAPGTREKGPEEADIQELEALIEKHKPQNPVDVFAIGQNLGTSEEGQRRQRALEEAVRRAQAKRFNADSPDVARAEFEVLSCLERNPRQIKRFDNAFRLQLHVASNTPGSVLDFNIDQLVALGKWVALRLRWPGVAKAIDEDPDLLVRLETYANEDRDAGSEIAEEEFRTYLADPKVLRVFREPIESRRMSSLPLASFLRVT